MKAAFIADDFIIDPLGIGYLSSYLKAAGHEVDLVKTNDPEMAQIVNEPPGMLCYSVTTGKHIRYREVNKWLRRNTNGDCVSVFGGPHITFFPGFCNQDYLDFGVRGEGFDALVEIANALDADREVSSIPNVVCGGHITPIRPLKPKNTLLMPDRGLMYKYEKNFRNPIKNVMCSFGCFYGCPYCYASKYKEMYNQRTAEIRPVDSINEEIRHLMTYPLELIFFQDDIFPIYARDWLDDFVRAYRSIRLPFHIQVRAEFINRDVISQLKEVGLHGVTFAIESGNPSLRQDILGRRMTDETIIDAAEILHQQGVKLRTENMVGIPGETWRTAMETVDLNIACKPTIAWASLFQPYPGTMLGDQCMEKGIFDGDIDDISESFFDTYRLKVKNAKRYERLQKLFSVIVKHPLLKKFAWILSSLPFSYRKLYSRYKLKLYGDLYKIG